MEDIKDKIPTLKDIVDNGKNAAETFEKRPTGSFVYIILFLSISTSIYFAYTAYQAQKKLNDMAQEAFRQAMENKVQRKVIQVQGEVIDSAKTYIQDSIQPVNIKNYKGNLKIKEK